MTTARALLAAMVAAALLIDARVNADEQFPRGLLAADPGDRGCTIETRPLSFGTYDPLAATSVDALGSVIYTCSAGGGGGGAGGGGGGDNGAIKNIRIEMSRGGSNSFNRRMTSGDDQLDYNVYLDADHRTVWGDGTSGTDYYVDPHPPNKTAVTVPAYGRIPGMQDVGAGQYTDVLTVTIHF